MSPLCEREIIQEAAASVFSVCVNACTYQDILKGLKKRKKGDKKKKESEACMQLECHEGGATANGNAVKRQRGRSSAGSAASACLFVSLSSIYRHVSYIPEEHCENKQAL